MRRVRILLILATLVMATGVLMVPTSAQDLQTVKLNVFSPRREVTLGSDLGLFAKRGIRVEGSITQSSERQAQELLDGTWDITGADADNYVYWTHDHNADFFIFMVTQGTTDNHLWVTSDIQSFDDLRGKVIAADSAFSGQTSMVRMMMQSHGLQIDRDYTFLPVGTNRLPAILDGRAVGASMGGATASTDAARSGQVHILARGPDYLPMYPSNPYATTRRWATAHPDTLIAFISAIIDAKAWLKDPSNERAAIASIERTDQVDEARATELYRQAVAANEDLSTATQVREDMIQLVEDMRVKVGLMEEPTPPPSKFVTSAWYDLALRLRAGVAP